MMIDNHHPSSSAVGAEEAYSLNNGNNSDAGFFERERNRLIQDISKGVESILGNSNVLNRKIEESISVGKEFHPISELWSKFERIMVASGIPNLHPQSQSQSQMDTAAEVGVEKENMDPSASATPATAAATAGGGGMGDSVTPRKVSRRTHAEGQDFINSNDHHTSSETPNDAGGAAAGGIRFETVQSTLPPGVAPGGGRIYAA